MTRPLLSLVANLVVGLMAAPAIARADFNPSHWQFRRSISVDQPEPVVSVTVDASIYRGSRTRLSDLRIIRDGSETPYLIRTLSGSHEEREWRPALLNKAVLPAVGLEATLDLGAHPTHNRLRISTRQKNFKQRVRIESSDDGRSWAIVRDDGYIFDFSQGDRQVSVLTVDYPESTRRFVKFTIYGWMDPEFLDSAWLTYYTATKGTADPLATLAVSATEDSKTQSTLLTADIGFEGLPHDRLQAMVNAEAGPFYRTVEIETSTDAKNWAFVGQDVISRTADREDTIIFFPEQWDRHLRLRILNHDSPPLAIRSLILSAYRRVVEFPANAAGQYWLYYGNADAKQPQYDFAQTLSHQTKAVELTAGAEQPNPAWRQPVPAEKPWSDRHPGVLYTVLVAAILIMGMVAVRFLLKIQR